MEAVGGNKPHDVPLHNEANIMTAIVLYRILLCLSKRCLMICSPAQSVVLLLSNTAPHLAQPMGTCDA